MQAGKQDPILKSELLSSGLRKKFIELNNPTVQEALAAWEHWIIKSGRNPITIEQYRLTLNRWAVDTGILREAVVDLDEDCINRFINAPGPKKAGSRKVALAQIRTFFSFCSAKGWIVGDPSKLARMRWDLLTHAQKETRERREFTEEEITTLLNATAPGGVYGSPFWYSVIAIARYTGLRFGDICQLQWDCFKKPGVITVWTDKRDKRVEVPISHIRLETAIACIPAVDPVWCFPEAAKDVKGFFTRTKYGSQFRKLCKFCGIVDKNFHDMRSTYATDCVRRGIPMPHVSQRLGHASTKQTDTYIVKEPWTHS